MIIQPKTMLEFPSGKQLELLVEDPLGASIGAFTAHGVANMDTSKYIPGKRLDYETKVSSFEGSYEKMAEWAHVNMLDIDNQRDAALVDAILDLGAQLATHHPNPSRTRVLTKDMVEGHMAALIRSVTETTNEVKKNKIVAVTLYGTLYNIK